METSDKTILVATHRLFVSHAQRLSRDFGRVLLYTPWESPSNCTMNLGMVGYGIEGVERVDSIFCDSFDDIDYFYFPDLGFADVELYLSSIGKNVWGARRGEELENYRDMCKKEMERLGLPVQPWKKLIGMDALREHLKTHENQYVKLNRWRGHFESFKSTDYETSKIKLDEIAHNMGAFQAVAEFMVEDELPDCVEIGIDTFCIDGQLPEKTIVGIEVKDLGYIGQFMDWSSIPEPVRRWHETMAPTFAKYGYRGWLSNELRIGKDKVPYMIDATCRAPSPPSELFQEQYANFHEIVRAGCQGEMIVPKASAKWGVELLLRSSWAYLKMWQPVTFDPKFANQVKLFDPAFVDGQWWVVPQEMNILEIGAVVGLGNTLDEAIENAKEVADSVHGFGIEVPDGSIQKAQEQMKQITEFGLDIFQQNDE